MTLAGHSWAAIERSNAIETQEKEADGGAKAIADTEIIASADSTGNPHEAPKREWLEPYKFKPGNKMGVGNKNAAKPPQYKNVLKAIVTEDEWHKVVTKALEQAQTGDNDARKWLSDILIAKQIKARGITLNLTPGEAQAKIDQLFGLDMTIGSGDDDSGPSD